MTLPTDQKVGGSSRERVVPADPGRSPGGSEPSHFNGCPQVSSPVEAGCPSRSRSPWTLLGHFWTTGYPGGFANTQLDRAPLGGVF